MDLRGWNPFGVEKMSDADPDASSGDELSDDGNPSAPPRRFTMKALGQLVDPESIAPMARVIERFRDAPGT